MIRVKIEMCPLGNEERAREIGRMYIANDGNTSVKDPSRGDYLVAVCRRGTTTVPREIYGDQATVEDALSSAPKAARTGTVTNYPRLTYNVWRLIARAVLAAFPEERKTREGSESVLDEQVMRGLQLLVDVACDNGYAGSVSTEDFEEMEIAKLWLAQAQLESP